jgi:hypothetical protein
MSALSYLFPPEVRRLRVPHGSVTLALVREGKIATVQPDPEEGGPVNVKQWNGKRWETIRTY